MRVWKSKSGNCCKLEEKHPLISKPNVRFIKTNEAMRVITDYDYDNIYKLPIRDQNNFYICLNPIIEELTAHKNLYAFTYTDDQGVQVLIVDKYGQEYKLINPIELESYTYMGIPIPTAYFQSSVSAPMLFETALQEADTQTMGSFGPQISKDFWFETAGLVSFIVQDRLLVSSVTAYWLETVIFWFWLLVLVSQFWTLVTDEENKIEYEGDMSQATQQVLPTIDEETPFHKGDAMSTQEVVEHESDFVAQKPSNDMNKGSENMLPTIGETQIHKGNTRNSEEKMVVVENQSDVQTSSKPSDDMIIKDTYNMPLRDEEVEGSEKKDEANEEHQGALATTEVQDKVDKGIGEATRNANKAQSIQGRVQGTEGVQGVGKIVLTAANNSSFTLVDALYVPGIKKNLLSISALARLGLVVKFVDDRCTVHDLNFGDEIVDSGILQCGLYKLTLYDKCGKNFANAVINTKAISDAKL
ncbi:hypothetical protein L7F22_048203 [Adiantum nelumboides]|nr:hypothetical protein [Adiantum nelumboides]